MGRERVSREPFGQPKRGHRYFIGRGPDEPAHRQPRACLRGRNIFRQRSIRQSGCGAENVVDQRSRLLLFASASNRDRKRLRKAHSRVASPRRPDLRRFLVSASPARYRDGARSPEPVALHAPSLWPASPAEPETGSSPQMPPARRPGRPRPLSKEPSCAPRGYFGPRRGSSRSSRLFTVSSCRNFGLRARSSNSGIATPRMPPLTLAFRTAILSSKNTSGVSMTGLEGVAVAPARSGCLPERSFSRR